MSRENKQKNGKRAVRALSLNHQGFCVKLQEAQQGKQRNWKMLYMCKKGILTFQA